MTPSIDIKHPRNFFSTHEYAIAHSIGKVGTITSGLLSIFCVAQVAYSLFMVMAINNTKNVAEKSFQSDPNSGIEVNKEGKPVPITLLGGKEDEKILTTGGKYAPGAKVLNTTLIDTYTTNIKQLQYKIDVYTIRAIDLGYLSFFTHASFKFFG